MLEVTRFRIVTTTPPLGVVIGSRLAAAVDVEARRSPQR